jgi:DNA-binding NarL/FixJ family response regulator
MKELELFSYLAELDEKHGSPFEEGLQLTALWIRRSLIQIDRLFTIFYPFFTLHDHTHSDAIVNCLYEIALRAKLVDPLHENALSRYETFYLLAAAYLHDIGMIVSLPDDQQRGAREGKSLSEIIRRDHHERSAQVAQDKKDDFLLTHQDADIIAALCRGHRITPLDGPEYQIRYDDRNRPIRVRLLAGLLRVADELDLAHKRAPERQRLILEGSGQLDPIARKHWMKHYYVESISLSAEEQRGTPTTVRINVELLVPDEIHAQHMRQEITERIEQHLKSVSFSEHGFVLALGKINDTPRPNLSLTSSVLRKQDVRILYVDDDKMDREEVTQALKERGFVHCDAASDSASALAKLAQVINRSDRQYHQIILDLWMPNLNGVSSPRAGVDLIPAAQKLCPDAQILVYTGSSTQSKSGVDRTALQEATRLGAGIVYKEQGCAALAQAIEAILAQSYIIIVQPQPTGKEEHPMSDKSYIPCRYRVLIVDDDPLWGQECAEALTSAGMYVDWADGASQAVDKLKQRRYHAAILDKNMPDLTGRQSNRAGLDLLEYMRENYPDTSCLILTLDPTLTTYREAMELGMFDYRDKSEIGPEGIAAIVSQMFQARLVTVRSQSGFAVKADRMYFWGRSGVVIREVSIDTGEDAGVIRIDDEMWKATTRSTPGSGYGPIPVGVEVHAREIKYDAIVVMSEMY